MVNPFSKLRKLTGRKRQTLCSICTGFVFFAFLYLISSAFEITLCPVRSIFGIKCLGCGMTRGFIAIMKLDFKAAFRYNVMSLPLFAGILLYCVMFILDVIFEKDFLERIELFLSRKYMYAVYFVVMLISFAINNIS